MRMNPPSRKKSAGRDGAPASLWPLTYASTAYDEVKGFAAPRLASKEHDMRRLTTHNQEDIVTPLRGLEVAPPLCLSHYFCPQFRFSHKFDSSAHHSLWL